MRERLVAIIAFLSLTSGLATSGEILRGRVVDREGNAVPGAIVSAIDRDAGRTTSVYSDETGRFTFPEIPGATVDVRARRFGFSDGFEMEAAAGADEIELRMDLETDQYERLSALPANRWLALALEALPDDTMREEFTRQCTFCHQQGNWATRVQRSPEEWDKVLRLMARMGGIVSKRTRDAVPALLNEAYDPETALSRLEAQVEAQPLPNPAGSSAVIDEWEVGDRASVQHDIVVHPSGHVFSVDTTKDLIHRLDPETGERRSYAIPDDGLPLGGVFYAAGNVMPPNSDARVAPHSLQVAPDGKIWVTLCMGNRIGILEPESGEWEVLEQETGLYPHTLRFDAKGRVWYTLAVSNHVGMIDPKTREQVTIRLPGRTWKQTFASWIAPYAVRFAAWLPQPETIEADMMPPVPYGVDIAPDGGVWFSQLNAHRIGRIDPETREYELFDTPFPAPRRLRFDSQGNHWIPGFSSGVVARFDLGTKKFRTWKLPIRPTGTETPYALNVDPKTDTVWICGTNSDTLIKLEPDEDRFTVFPLPHRVTYTREIDFDEEGGVWTSNSNTPGWHIESQNPTILRLREHGGRSMQVAGRSNAPGR